LGYCGLAAGKVAWARGKRDLGLRLFAALHSANLSTHVDHSIESWIRAQLTRRAPAFLQALGDFVQRYGSGGSLAPHLQDPLRMLGSRIVILKKAQPREKGVVLLGYSYVFPLFARMFDVGSVADRYHIVLEPSWCGLCALEVLSFTQYDFPVFVECWEPKDAKFLAGIDSNLIPVPLADNWWVDHRVFKPDPAARKDIDVIMVAAWARFKRHRQFFKALRELKRHGKRLRVALVGYAVDRSKTDILMEADAFGIRDWLELHEDLSPTDVVRLLNRSKVHVLWSRNEGANRAHVEAMFVGVPSIVHDGFNFGYRQPHVNAQTGAYATEAELPDVLVRMIEKYEDFSPREWVLENMSCQRATSILGASLREHSIANGEKWSETLAVKTVLLGTQRYWDPDDADRFREDYRFLESRILAG